VSLASFLRLTRGGDPRAAHVEAFIRQYRQSSVISSTRNQAPRAVDRDRHHPGILVGEKKSQVEGRLAIDPVWSKN